MVLKPITDDYSKYQCNSCMILFPMLSYTSDLHEITFQTKEMLMSFTVRLQSKFETMLAKYRQCYPVLTIGNSLSLLFPRTHKKPIYEKR